MVVHSYYYRDARVRRYAQTLAQAGIRVDILCLRHHSDKPDRGKGLIRVFTLPIGRFATGSWGYVLEYGLAFILFSSWLLGLHVRNRYEVIHVHNMPDFLVFSTVIPRFLGAKVILDIHDPMPEVYISKFKLREKSTVVRLMRIQEKLSMRFADLILIANPLFRDNIAARGAPLAKITVIKNIPDPSVFDRKRYRGELCISKTDYTLVYPGTIAPRYGLDVAIRGMARLVIDIPEVRLVIIGHQGEFVNRLRALVSELGVSTAVRFKPSVPVEEVPREIAQADIGIYPALPDPHMSIAVPTKVLEYAIMGIPIVASRLRVLQDLLDESAISFFEPGNADQYAERVLALYRNRERGRRMVLNADRLLVQTHSWASESEKYFAALRKLVGPDKRIDGASEVQA